MPQPVVVGANSRNGVRGTQRVSNLNGIRVGDGVNTGGGLPMGSHRGQQHGNAMGQNDRGITRNINNGRIGVGNATASQVRAGRWRSSGGNYVQQVQSRLKCFRRGSNRYKRKIRPSKESLLTSIGATPSVPAPTAPSFSAAAELRLTEEQRAVEDIAKSIREGSHGYVEDRKPSDVIRLYCENVDSLSLYDDAVKHIVSSRLINGSRPMRQ